jgi:F420H(2)-dependent quinone reductase
VSSGGSTLFSLAGRVLSHRSMRPVTRTFSDLHAALYRMTGGAAQNPNYPTMLLTVTGRKTGKPRTVPLIYLEDGDRLVIAAAYAGSKVNPTWWLNLRDNPEAVAQLRDRTVAVRATLAEQGERAELWKRLVAMYPYFAEYQTRTDREIPVIVLTPTADQPPSRVR